jgi:hypothetical protein
MHVPVIPDIASCNRVRTCRRPGAPPPRASPFKRSPRHNPHSCTRTRQTLTHTTTPGATKLPSSPQKAKPTRSRTPGSGAPKSRRLPIHTSYLLSLGSLIRTIPGSSSDLTLFLQNPRNMRMQRDLILVQTSHYSTKPASARPTTATANERTNKTLPTKHRARVLR